MKIIATDYDGTLNHNGIDAKKREAIARWRQKGNLFGVVSGRGYDSLLEVISSKKFEYDFLLCCNGAVICNKEGEVLSDSRCNGKIAKPLLRDLFLWGCPFAAIEKDSQIMVRSSGKECRVGEFTYDDMPEIMYFNQISTMLECDEDAAEIVQKIKVGYGDSLNPLQNGRCIDIVSVGMDKAKGIYDLLSLVGGEYSDVITVGDNINDEAMIGEFRSYAMENGVESVKKLANYIITDITELIEKEI